MFVICLVSETSKENKQRTGFGCSGRGALRRRDVLLRTFYQGRHLLPWEEVCPSSFRPPDLRPDIFVCPPASALVTGLLKGGRGCVLNISSAPVPAPVTTSVRAGGGPGSPPGLGPEFSPRITRGPRFTNQREGPKPDVYGATPGKQAIEGIGTWCEDHVVSCRSQPRPQHVVQPETDGQTDRQVNTQTY